MYHKNCTSKYKHKICTALLRESTCSETQIKILNVCHILVTLLHLFKKTPKHSVMGLQNLHRALPWIKRRNTFSPFAPAGPGCPGRPGTPCTTQNSLYKLGKNETQYFWSVTTFLQHAFWSSFKPKYTSPSGLNISLLFDTTAVSSC